MWKYSYSKLLKKIALDYYAKGGWNRIMGTKDEVTKFIYSGQFSEETEEAMYTDLLEWCDQEEISPW